MRKKLQKELVGDPYDRLQETMIYSWPWLHEDLSYQVSTAIEEKVELRSAWSVYLLTSRSPVWKKEINDGNPT